MVLSAAQEARGITDVSPVVQRRRRWRGRTRPDIIPTGDWPEIVGRLLALRGIDSSRARTVVPRPHSQRPSAGRAAQHRGRRRSAAAGHGASETVAIFGDFDVDGVTSAAQLSLAFGALGAVPVPYIPDRFSEGYGLNIPAIERLRSDGATLLVTPTAAPRPSTRSRARARSAWT